MAELPPGPIRCAIYTRKSTDEGLEQSFNTLDAQREACEAYAASQRHEGWAVLPTLYDDGGYSGGTLDRPALKQLLADVSVGKVDVIIIYKIDRLTRSLADFARIVDVLDRASASFVSVTQSFNTTSSMGRLTLNVLLSFAQFEREVGAERVRDKIAASKRKGMWMGGVCPLGYDVRDRALVVNDAEAITVRQIFDTYLRLGSVRSLEAVLRQQGTCSKVRLSRGTATGGNPISRGALYVLLRNVLYIGQVSHKGTVHPGQHQAIVDPEIFRRTQLLLDSHIARLRKTRPASTVALLTGCLWDAQGRPMSPTHTTKGSRHYRYYQSRRNADDASKPVRVPAGELESLIVARVQAFLLNPASLHDALERLSLDASFLNEAIERARYFAINLDTPSRTVETELRQCFRKVELASDAVRLSVDVGLLLFDGRHSIATEFEIPARLIRRTKEVRLIVPPRRGRRNRIDAGLIKLLVRARQVRVAFEKCGPLSLTALATKLGYQPDYFTVLLKLGYLSPTLVEAILNGTQPPALTRQYLARVRALPVGWSDQAELLNGREFFGSMDPGRNSAAV